MTDTNSVPQLVPGQAAQLGRLGLVVHPTRDLDTPFEVLERWAERYGTELVEIPFVDEHTRRYPDGRADACQMLVAIGGDGTTLAAIRAAAPAQRPVLGVACGSLGALTTVPSEQLDDALRRVEEGRWDARQIPGLRVTAEPDLELRVYNDLVVARRGDGQIRVSSRVDGTLYTRLAGDGVIVATPAGSGAYTLAAGGPLLAPELEAFVLTPLPTHGGVSPSLVLNAGARLELEVTAGHGGARLELDGRDGPAVPAHMTVELVPRAATIVTFAGQEAHIAGMRQRGILADSPRIIADERRAVAPR